MTVKTPVVKTIEIDGYSIKIHSATLGLLRKMRAATTTDDQMAAAESIINSVAEIEGVDVPADVLSVAGCNRVITISMGLDAGEPEADFPPTPQPIA